MRALALVAGLVAFGLATFDVTVLVDSIEQMIAAGLAFVALALVLGSLPRAPRA